MATEDGTILNAFRVRVQVEVDQDDLERQIHEVVSRVTDRFGSDLAEKARLVDAPQEGRERAEDDEKPERIAEAVAEAVERALGGMLARMESDRSDRLGRNDIEEEVDIRQVGSIVIDNEQIRHLEDISDQLGRVLELLEDRQDQ